MVANTLQKNLPCCIPTQQQSQLPNRDGEQQSHGSFNLACCHDFPDSTGYFAFTRNDISAFICHHQMSRQHRCSSMCPRGP